MDYKQLSNKYRTAWRGEKPGLAGDPNYMDFSKLVSIGSGSTRKLIAPAASSYERMKRAVNGKWDFSAGPKTFRPIDEERKICAQRTCDGVSKAKPGYSRHGWGRAVDFSLIGDEVKWKLGVMPNTGTPARGLFDWLCAHAIEFGWVNYLAEAWHWEYVGEPPGTGPNPAIKGNPDYKPNPSENNASEDDGDYSNNRQLPNDGNSEQTSPEERKKLEESTLALFKEISSSATSGKALAESTTKEVKETKKSTDYEAKQIVNNDVQKDKINIVFKKNEDDKK